MPDDIRNRIAAALCLALVLAAFGCHKGGSSSRENGASRSVELPEESQAAISPDSKSDSTTLTGLATAPTVDGRSIDHIDEGMWTTESVSQQTEKVLKAILATTLSNNFDPHHLTSGFSADVPAGDFAESFHDDQITVWRPSETAARATIKQPTEFFAWLKHAARITDDTTFKLKTFGINIEGQRASTDVWVRTHAIGESHATNVTSLWRCDWKLNEHPELSSINVQEFEVAAIASSRSLFSDRTVEVLGNTKAYGEQLVHGLNHWLDRLELYDGIIATSYHGLAIADVNNDGLDDIYLCQPGGASGGLPNRLFIQQPDGTAIDASAESGTDWLIETHGALFVDLDNDGDQDLVASTIAGLIFAMNDGQGRFEPKAHKVTAEAPPIAI
ncbi:MAG: VCBS repeat-containing protein, partial [Planctomycetales bacterium]|nr:VCBS repeat-containing protein [Planctomycetales bacterium]